MAKASKMFWRCPCCKGMHELTRSERESVNGGQQSFKQFCNVKLILVEITLAQLQPEKSKVEQSKKSNNGWTA